MKLPTLLFLLSSLAGAMADEASITWLVNYDGKALPAAPWVAVAKPDATLDPEGLRLRDVDREFGSFRAAWQPQPDSEIIVEARVKVLTVTGAMPNKPATALWPWRDGAPVMVQVSDGQRQDGLVLFPAQAASFTDRFIPLDTTNRFHTYRLVIRGRDMAMFVDGERKVEGQGAFWKAADSPEPFIAFGSTAKTATGEAIWESVRLGVRKTSAPAAVDPVKITVSPSWEIPRAEVRQTRPYLYDLGRGLLLMSVAQGPDAFYEPYGLLKSTDAGKTWTPIPGLDQVDTTPLPIVRRPNGTILAISRWTRLQPDGSVVGKTTRLDADATTFTMIDNRIVLPPQYANEAKSDQTVCERHLWNDDDGGVTMVVWSRKGVKRPDGRNNTERWSHLLRSTDEGATWNYFATVGTGGRRRASCSASMAAGRGRRITSSPIASASITPRSARSARAGCSTSTMRRR